MAPPLHQGARPPLHAAYGAALGRALAQPGPRRPQDDHGCARPSRCEVEHALPVNRCRDSAPGERQARQAQGEVMRQCDAPRAAVLLNALEGNTRLRREIHDFATRGDDRYRLLEMRLQVLSAGGMLSRGAPYVTLDIETVHKLGAMLDRFIRGELAEIGVTVESGER